MDIHITYKGGRQFLHRLKIEDAAKYGGILDAFFMKFQFICTITFLVSILSIGTIHVHSSPFREMIFIDHENLRYVEDKELYFDNRL